MHHIGLKLILFAPSLTVTAKKIADAVNLGMGLECARICHHPKMLIAARLQAPMSRRVAILLAADQQELDLMVELAPWFLDSPALLLMVPDHRRSTIAKAHRLRPRYIMEPEINYRQLLTVLECIINYSVSSLLYESAA